MYINEVNKKYLTSKIYLAVYYSQICVVRPFDMHLLLKFINIVICSRFILLKVMKMKKYA